MSKIELKVLVMPADSRGFGLILLLFLGLQRPILYTWMGWEEWTKPTMRSTNSPAS